MMQKRCTSRSFIGYILLSVAAVLLAGCGGGAVGSGELPPVLMVTTLAGSAGQRGVADGTGPAARFSNPMGVATDKDGNVYVAEFDACTIRKITPVGVVSTLAGLANNCAEQDGVGTSARFAFLAGIAADRDSNIYVTDRYTVRKITSTGKVTTLAGAAGKLGWEDGSGTNARFNEPFGLALDSIGNAYIADTKNYTIRKMDITGKVTTLAGAAGQPGIADGQGAAARFSWPKFVATDAAGNVYVTDELTVRKITSEGAVSTLADLGVAPTGIAVDKSGNVYAANMMKNIILKITPTGVVTTLAGAAGQTGSTDGLALNARFDGPVGLSVDLDGNMYVGDSFNNTIRKIGPGYTIGGKATGLAGVAVLKNVLDYGTDSLTVEPDSSFTFDLPAAKDGTYAVTVQTPPPGQTCTVTGGDSDNGNGTGTITGHVNNIAVACTGTPTPAYALSGNVTGLLANTSVVLQNNGNTVTVTNEAPAFAFAKVVAAGEDYAVSVQTQPSGQTCTVAGGANGDGSGKASADVTNLSVTCEPNTYSITVKVSGLLTGGMLAVQNKDAEPLYLMPTNSSVVFQQVYGSAYDVHVASGQQPTGQVCTLSAPLGDRTSGTLSGNVTILATCTTQNYPIGVTVMGLDGSSGGSLLLQNNLADDLSVTADGIFDFSTQLAYQSPYNVTISASPADRACTVDNGNGTTTAPGSMVVVTCFPLGGGSGGSGGGSGLYTISGVVNNLSYPGMELQNNGGDNLMLGVPFPTPGSLPFTFATPVAGTYSVTVSINPPNQTCTVTSGGSGTATGNVSNVVIDCN